MPLFLLVGTHGIGTVDSETFRAIFASQTLERIAATTRLAAAIATLALLALALLTANRSTSQALFAHLDFRYGYGVAIGWQISRQFDSVPGVSGQVCKILIRNLINITVADEHKLASILHARKRAIMGTHFLPVV